MPSTSNDEVKHINPYISKSIAYINNNLKNKITINDVCQYINLSKFYFSRIFKSRSKSSLFFPVSVISMMLRAYLTPSTKPRS